VERLEQADGVVVQGPPGTGKSHTIANIICHYLALGKRVLVTSKGEPALAVLRDHIPETIRPLVISLLTSEREGLKQLGDAVDKIAAEVADLDAAALRRKIADLQRRVEYLHEHIAALDHDLRAWAERQFRPVAFFGNALTPDQLARQVLDGRERYGWLTDDLGADDRFAPQFSESDIANLRAARRTAGADLVYLGERLARVEGLPTIDELARLQSDLVQFQALDSQLSTGAIAPLAGSDDETLASARSLRDFAHALHAMQPLFSVPWLAAMKRLWQVPAGDERPIVLDLMAVWLAEVERLEQTRQRLLAVPVDLPAEAIGSAPVREAVGRAAEGRRPFRWLAVGKEVRRWVEAIRVAGEVPATREAWQAVADHLDLLAETRGAAARWTVLAAEVGGPPVTGKEAGGLREMADLARQIAHVRTVALEDEPRFTALLPTVIARGFDPDTLCGTPSELERLVAVLDHHLEHARLRRVISARDKLFNEVAGCGGPVGDRLRAFVDETLGDPAQDPAAVGHAWGRLRAEVERVQILAEDLAEIDRVTTRIADSGAPHWAAALCEQPATDDDPLLPVDWRTAWEWARAWGYLQAIDGRQALQGLSVDRLRAEDDLRHATERLVEQLTWLRLKEGLTPDLGAALQAYLTAIRRMKRGTGIRAPRFRRDAQKAMATAHRAVPCWIMPHWRVSESLPAELGSFDLVIIDEASQSDAWALPSIVRGKQLLVVGDDKQVSPSDVGIKDADIRDLEHRYLREVPYGNLFLSGSSIYAWGRAVFATDALVLREHFRCVEPIIAFSSRHFYPDGLLRPLRIPKPSERIDPPLVDIFVKGGYRPPRNDVNPPEAHCIVAEIKALAADPRFQGRTIGVVSLLGHDQAHLIQEQLIAELGEEVYMRHKIRCGDAMTFQGKEADIVFLSMVADSANLRAVAGTLFEQRFNVAASRARDRMYLVRSVTREQLRSQEDLRAKLLDHFASPLRQDTAEVGHLRERCESDFERAVFDTLVARDYRVTPQVRVGRYRIDLVIDGTDDRRLAVELDGSQHHDVEQWQHDMSRQRTLERMGWRFWRCWASSYYADPEACLADLTTTLNSMGIAPLGAKEVVVGRYTEHRVVEPGDGGVSGSKGDAEGDGTGLDGSRHGEIVPVADAAAPGSADGELSSRDDPGSTPADRRGQTSLAFGEDNLRVEIGDTVGFERVDAPGEVRYVQINAGRGDPRAGTISPHAPLAVELLSKRRGDEVEVHLPQGIRRLRIVEIDRPRT